MAKRRIPETANDDEDDFAFDNLNDADVEIAAQEARDIAIVLGAKVIRELFDIAADSKCSTQARVAAGNGVLRAGGFFNHSNDEIGKKEIHQMSSGELQAAIDTMEKIAEQRQKAKSGASRSETNIFD